MNCKAELGLTHLIVNLKDRNSVTNALLGLLEIDNDLTENEEYFQEDTISLGYENEADRIVKEYLQASPDCLLHPLEFTYIAFTLAVDEISKFISEQEYFGSCNIDITDLGDDRASLVFAWGGQ